MRLLRREILNNTIQWVREFGVKGAQPSSWIQKEFAISRQQATRYLHYLVENKILRSEGTGRATRYFHNQRETLIFEYEVRLDDDQGDSTFRSEDILPKLAVLKNKALSECILQTLHILIENCKKHSDATYLQVVATLADLSITLKVKDNGCGIFVRNLQNFSSRSMIEAIAETIKGSRCMSDENFSVYGLSDIFQCAEFVTVKANGYSLEMMYQSSDWSVAKITSSTGTEIAIEFDVDSDAQFSKVYPNSQKLTAAKVVVPIGLFCRSIPRDIPTRTEAKKILRGVGRFHIIILDFKGVKKISRSFVEYIYLDFKSKNTNRNIMSINMNDSIRTMIKTLEFS